MSEHESEKKKGNDMAEFIKQYLLSPVDEFMHSVYKVSVAVGSILDRLVRDGQKQEASKKT